MNTPIDFESLAGDFSISETYLLSENVYNGFVSLFEDRNALHMDDAYARELGFSARVMHGAILQGFLSHFVGTVFPGDGSLIVSVQMHYQKPCFLDDSIQLKAKVSHRSEQMRTVEMIVEFVRARDDQQIAKAKVLVRVAVPK